MPDLVAGARLPEGMSKQEMYIQLNVNVQVAHARAVEVIKRVDPQAQVGDDRHAHLSTYIVSRRCNGSCNLK